MTQTVMRQRGICPVPGCSLVFASGHAGVDRHALAIHGHLLTGATGHERYEDFKRLFPRPWPYAERVATAPLAVDTRSGTDPEVDDDFAPEESESPQNSTEDTYATFRENLVEHLFIAEVLQEAWVKHRQDIEVLRAEIDAGGYDLVLGLGNVTRHVQLKAMKAGGKTAKQFINTKLAEKPAGCVVWLIVHEDRERGRITLDYRFFGGGPHDPLPSLSSYPIARRATHNKDGVRPERPGIREVPARDFVTISDGVAGLLRRLFGNHAHVDTGTGHGHG